MQCQKYEAQVQRFLEGKLSDHDAENFIRHVQGCKRCYEELEIYFSIFRGLGFSKSEELVKDDAFEFDGKKEDLVILMDQMLAEIRKRKIQVQIKIFLFIFLLVAGFAGLLTLVAQIYQNGWFW